MKAYLEWMRGDYNIALCYGHPVHIEHYGIFDRCVIITNLGKLCLCGRADKFPVLHKRICGNNLIAEGNDYE